MEKYPNLESLNETDDKNIRYIDKLSVCVPKQVSLQHKTKFIFICLFFIEMGRII